MQPPAPPPQPFQQQMQQQFGRGGTDRERGGLRTPRDVAALVSMLDNLTGGDPTEDLPLGALQEATKHVATFSRKAAPKLIQQKRNFVRGWSVCLLPRVQASQQHVQFGAGARCLLVLRAALF